MAKKRTSEEKNPGKPKPLYVPMEVTKVCLKCDKDFISLGNRICDYCTEENLRVGKRIGKSGPGRSMGKKIPEAPR